MTGLKTTQSTKTTLVGAIGFEDHKIHCIIGDLEHERGHEQDILIDLRVEADLSDCIKTDVVDDTINYVVLAELCTRISQQGKYRMLEMLAWQITERLLKDFPILSVWIKIKKPGGLPTTKNAFIELNRSR